MSGWVWWALLTFPPWFGVGGYLDSQSPLFFCMQEKSQRHRIYRSARSGSKDIKRRSGLDAFPSVYKGWGGAWVRPSLGAAEDEGKERSGETTEERCEGQRQNHKVLSMVTARAALRVWVASWASSDPPLASGEPWASAVGRRFRNHGARHSNTRSPLNHKCPPYVATTGHLCHRRNGTDEEVGGDAFLIIFFCALQHILPSGNLWGDDSPPEPVIAG